MDDQQPDPRGKPEPPDTPLKAAHALWFGRDAQPGAFAQRHGTEIRIDGEPLTFTDGKIHLSTTAPATAYPDNGGDLKPGEISAKIDMTITDPETYERAIGLAVAPPAATFGMTIRRLRIRRRLARLGPLVRRPRGRRLLRATFSRIDITIPSVRFSAPDEGEHA